uniref:Helicase ATP-binding domain-containing protein n=1 Tax=Panagrolaimus superbus TaxID=310955 RepID=A0A914Y282_9BILA
MLHTLRAHASYDDYDFNMVLGNQNERIGDALKDTVSEIAQMIPSTEVGPTPLCYTQTSFWSERQRFIDTALDEGFPVIVKAGKVGRIIKEHQPAAKFLISCASKLAVMSVAPYLTENDPQVGYLTAYSAETEKDPGIIYCSHGMALHMISKEHIFTHIVNDEFHRTDKESVKVFCLSATVDAALQERCVTYFGEPIIFEVNVQRRYNIRVVDENFEPLQRANPIQPIQQPSDIKFATKTVKTVERYFSNGYNSVDITERQRNVVVIYSAMSMIISVNIELRQRMLHNPVLGRYKIVKVHKNEDWDLNELDSSNLCRY